MFLQNYTELLSTDLFFCVKHWKLWNYISYFCIVIGWMLYDSQRVFLVFIKIRFFFFFC